MPDIYINLINRLLIIKKYKVRVPHPKRASRIILERLTAIIRERLMGERTYCIRQHNFAGGRPAAGYFLASLILQFFVRAETQPSQSFVFLPAKKTPVSAQPKSNQKEGAPGLPPLRGALDSPQTPGLRNSP
jgi:hypothetical protein